MDRLIELHFKYTERVQVVDNRIEKEKQVKTHSLEYCLWVIN